MPQRTDIFSLGRMGLTSGEGRRLELHTALAPLELGGERYVPDPELAAIRLPNDLRRSGALAQFLQPLQFAVQPALVGVEHRQRVHQPGHEIAVRAQRLV